mmetsp:Transcript_17239/g.25548  ORF Transcript_17239/g.25548 Transcript_17239/m.25548 type:complete len:352 (-) Transcript_17239:161-1216(-)
MAQDRSPSKTPSIRQNKSSSERHSKSPSNNNATKDIDKKNHIPSTQKASRSRSRSSSSSSSSSYSSKSSSRPRRRSRRGRSESSLRRRGRKTTRSPPKKQSPTKADKARSPSPATVLHVSNLSRNVKVPHLEEIFGCYGSIAKVELAVDKKVNLPKGYGFVEFNSRNDAEQAQLYLDGGQLDGNYLKVAFILFNKKKDQRHTSPLRNSYKANDSKNRSSRNPAPRVRSPYRGYGSRNIHRSAGYYGGAPRHGSGMGRRPIGGPQKSYADMGVKRSPPRDRNRGKARESRSPPRRRVSRSRSNHKNNSVDRRRRGDNLSKKRSYSRSSSKSLSSKEKPRRKKATASNSLSQG